MHDTKFKKKLSYGFFSKLMMNDSLERACRLRGEGHRQETSEVSS